MLVGESENMEHHLGSELFNLRLHQLLLLHYLLGIAAGVFSIRHEEHEECFGRVLLLILEYFGQLAEDRNKAGGAASSDTLYLSSVRGEICGERKDVRLVIVVDHTTPAEMEQVSKYSHANILPK